MLGTPLLLQVGSNRIDTLHLALNLSEKLFPLVFFVMLGKSLLLQVGSNRIDTLHLALYLQGQLLALICLLLFGKFHLPRKDKWQNENSHRHNAKKHPLWAFAIVPSPLQSLNVGIASFGVGFRATSRDRGGAKYLLHQNTDRKDVAAGVYRPGLRLQFGRCVARCATERAHSVLGIAIRQAEVNQFQRVVGVGDEYIFGFQVVVDYAPFVEITDRREEFGEDAFALLF